MKKVIFVFAIATSLVACGGSSTEANTTDSTSVDSTAVFVDTAAVAADTTVVVDSAK